MLFPFETLVYQCLLVFLLLISTIFAIFINNANLTGKKKYYLFKSIRFFTQLFMVPVSLFLIIANIWGITEIEFITIENVTSRGIIIIVGIITVLLSAFSIVPRANEGMKEVRRKSITASKYQKIFKKLRANFVTIMLTITIGFWAVYLWTNF